MLSLGLAMSSQSTPSRSVLRRLLRAMLPTDADFGVFYAAFSPDGRRIVTTSIDKIALVWEAEGGRLLAKLKGHRSTVNGAMFSPDGRRIVTAGWDRTARVWETEGGRLLAEFIGHGEGINSATFSPDGRRIVTASSDGTARAWEAESGRSVVVLNGHSGIVERATFSPDGRRILTMSSGIGRVWDAEDWHQLAVLDFRGRP